MNRRLFGLMTIALSASAFAADVSGTPSAGTSAAAEQRLRQDMQLLLTRLSASGALGDHPDQIALNVDSPERRVADLGVLVDSASADHAHDGLRVLGTTPGGAAEHGGLRAGDVIVSVNGTSLRNLGADADGHPLAASTLRTSVDSAAASNLQLDVLRNGDLVAMNVPVQSILIPAMHVQLGGVSNTASDPAPAPSTAASGSSGGCGHISDFDVTPYGQHIYRARILLIDGVTPGPTGVKSFRVSAGPHQLLVSEDIPTGELGMSALGSYRFRQDTNKKLMVAVKPNTTALIGAQLHMDKANNIAHGEYWDPVVWRESPDSCR